MPTGCLLLGCVTAWADFLLQMIQEFHPGTPPRQGSFGQMIREKKKRMTKEIILARRTNQNEINAIQTKSRP